MDAERLAALERVLRDIGGQRRAVSERIDLAVVEVADANPEMVGAEQLLCMDLLYDLVGRLRRSGLKVAVPEVGPPQVGGLLPGGMFDYRPDEQGRTRQAVLSTFPGDARSAGERADGVPPCYGSSPLLKHYRELRTRQDVRAALDPAGQVDGSTPTWLKPLSLSPTALDAEGKARLRGRLAEVKAGTGTFVGKYDPPGEPTVGWEGTVNADPSVFAALAEVARVTSIEVVRDDFGRVCEVRAKVEAEGEMCRCHEPPVPVRHHVPSGPLAEDASGPGFKGGADYIICDDPYQAAANELTPKGASREPDPLAVFADALLRAGMDRLDREMMADAPTQPPLGVFSLDTSAAHGDNRDGPDEPIVVEGGGRSP